MKKVIFSTLIILTPFSVFADNGLNLGGLLSIDDKGNIDLGIGETSISIDDSNVELGTANTKIKTDGNYQVKPDTNQIDTNTSLSTGSNKINVNTGNTELSTSGMKLSTNTAVNIGSTVLVTERAELINADTIISSLSQGAGTRIDLTVNFRTGSDKLYGNAHAQVAEIAKALKMDALNNAKILIEGHTDNVGSDDANFDLSFRRAATVQLALIKDYDVNSENLTIKGFGEKTPIADNNSTQGRSLNRRVTLVRQ